MSLTSLPRHPLTGLPLEPVGYRANGLPIWPILGAAEDDDPDDGVDEDGDDDSDDEDGDSDDDSDDADDSDDKGKPKSKDEEIAELRQALRKANRDARRNRRRATGKPEGKDGEGDDDDGTPDVTERATAMAKPIVIRAEARTLLTDAGFTGDSKAAARLIRTLDLKTVDVELDEDGEVVDIDGLDEQIEELKEDWPQLFGEVIPARRRSAGRIDATRDGSGGGRGRGSSGKAKSATERQAEQLMGRGSGRTR